MLLICLQLPAGDPTRTRAEANLAAELARQVQCEMVAAKRPLAS